MADGRARNFSLVSHDQIIDCIPKSAAVVDFVSYFDPNKKSNQIQYFEPENNDNSDWGFYVVLYIENIRPIKSFQPKYNFHKINNKRNILPTIHEDIVEQKQTKIKPTFFTFLGTIFLVTVILCI
jgi:hypothetical protein